MTELTQPRMGRPAGRAIAVIATLLAGAVHAADKPCPYENAENWKAAVPDRYEARAEYAFVEANPARPNVLIIGDSISMQYTPGVQKRLMSVANVYRAPNNCRSTRQSVDEIEIYLGCKDWDVIHFNWGIHDITHLNEDGKVAPPPAGSLQVPPDEYRANFEKLIARLQETGSRLIWATTTPIGQQTESRGYRRDADVQAYNDIAAELIVAEPVVINDLYALVKPRAEELLKDGVHFKSAGARVLAEAVSDSIRRVLSSPEDTPTTSAAE